MAFSPPPPQPRGKALFFQCSKGAHDSVDLFIAVRGIDAAAQQGNASRRGRWQHQIHIHTMGDQFAPETQPFFLRTDHDRHYRTDARPQGISQLGEAVVQAVRVAPQFFPQLGMARDFCSAVRTDAMLDGDGEAVKIYGRLL